MSNQVGMEEIKKAAREYQALVLDNMRNGGRKLDEEELHHLKIFNLVAEQLELGLSLEELEKALKGIRKDKY